jgi:hypothetical protein
MEFGGVITSVDKAPQSPQDGAILLDSLGFLRRPVAMSTQSDAGGHADAGDRD